MLSRLLRITLNLGAILLFFLLLSLLLCSGCAHTQSGLDREALAYQVSTNATAFLARYAAPLVPAPYSGLANLAIGAVGAGLGAWSLSQEKRLKALRAEKPKT